MRSKVTDSNVYDNANKGHAARFHIFTLEDLRILLWYMAAQGLGKGDFAVRAHMSKQHLCGIITQVVTSGKTSITKRTWNRLTAVIPELKK